MAANVSFVKGLREQLPDTYVEGRFLVTTDERAIYLDLDSESNRIRLGDFQEVQSLEELRKITKPSTTALYYIKDDNILAKYEGSGWKQINPDTGATGVETEGVGNAVTGIEYDAATRKLKIKLEKTFVEESALEEKFTAKLGNISEQTVKEYVDEKTKDIASESEITDIKGRLTTIEGEGEGSIKKAVVDAKTELTGLINGKANAEHEHDIEDVTGLQDALDLKATTAALETEKGRITTLETTVAGLSGAMNFKGEVHEDPTQMSSVEDYKNGDVVLWGEKEYVFNEGEFHEFGDVSAEGKRISALETKLTGVETVTGYVTEQIAGKADKTEVTALVGTESTITAGTIKEAAKEAENYADTKDSALKAALVGTDAGEEDTIKGAVKEAKEYADGKIEGLNIDDYAKTEAMTQADQTNLQAAKAYTDEKLTWGEF